ncbi:MAG: hypothetical protein K2M53_05170 [Muribaculaceae bacterium]|nr:hypothetical protein [Muribaculaceae bacterium]
MMLFIALTGKLFKFIKGFQSSHRADTGKRYALAEVGNCRPISPAAIAFRDHEESCGCRGSEI